MKLGTWLLAMCQPLIAKILVALGMSVVTVTGMNVIFSGLKTMIINGFLALPVSGLQLFLLAGGGQALGIIMGALTTRLFLISLQNNAKIIGKAPS